MGFFKDFKEDFDQAVGELMPGEEAETTEVNEEEIELTTVEEDIDVANELSKIDGLLEVAAKKAEAGEEVVTNAPTPSAPTSAPSMPRPSFVSGGVSPTKADSETAVITAGMIIHGSVESTGSVEVQGILDGDITCSGKLVVTGELRGNSVSSEFFADAAKVEGEVNTSGTVKIGNGSIVVGNITSTSAVIAGAVKGDIDVNGPVVVDTSAIVMGNIKSRSVQINNGAVIEGFCSQIYSEVDVESVFTR